MVPCDVVHATFHAAVGGPKEKFLIIVDPDRGWGFLINSRPFVPASAQVAVNKPELTFLAHESCIDTAKIICIHDIAAQVDAGTAKVVGHVQLPLRKRIHAAIAAHGVLPEQHATLVAERFGLTAAPPPG